MLGCLERSSPPPFPFSTLALPSDLSITLAFQVCLFLSSETLPLLSIPRRCPQVVIYGHESWTIKKAEHQRIDAFQLWCWRRLLSPLDCKDIQPAHPKGNQSWIFIGRTDAEVEVLRPWSPDVKSWHTRKDSEAGNDWKAGGEGDDREWDGWMPSPTRWTWVWVNSGSWWWTGRPGVLQSLGSQRVRHNWAAELMMNWFLPCFPWNPTRIPFNSWDPSPLEQFCHLPSVNASFQINDLLILPLQWEQKTN